jgi:hypothetical protein
MKIEGDVKVYSEPEKKVVGYKDTFEARGLDPVTAARYALYAANRLPSKEFIEDFSGGSLTKTDGKVVIVR